MTIDTLTMILLVMLGFIVGFSVKAIFFREKKRDIKPAGQILVNTLDPQKDVITLSLTIPIIEMIAAKELSFEVVTTEE